MPRSFATGDFAAITARPLARVAPVAPGVRGKAAFSAREIEVIEGISMEFSVVGVAFPFKTNHALLREGQRVIAGL
jgi:hypothetical protein